ncbi:MAG: response regulator [Anaerolineales bacterium]
MSDERILVIDDGKENRDFIVEYVLEPNGYAALVARDGQEGLAIVRAEMPDLILLDLQMPRMNGMQVLDALNAEGLDIPVILMTFHGSEEIAIEVYRKGVRDYVKKPYTVEEMVMAIDRSLTEVRLRREKEQLTQRLIESNSALNQRVRELNLLYGVGKSVTAALDAATLMMRIAQAAAQLTSCEESSLYLLENNALICKAITRQTDGQTYLIDEARDEPLARRALENGQLVVLGAAEIEAARRVNPSAPAAALAAPLVIGEHVMGAVVVKNLTPGARLFTRNDGALLSALSDYAAIGIENTHWPTAPGGLDPSGDGIHHALRRAVRTDVMNQIMADPSLAAQSGQRCELSVLRGHLHGHLGFVKKAPPEQIVALLNEYMLLAAEAIFAAQGTLETLHGDAFSAFFNAPTAQPDHLERLIHTAWDIQARVAQYNAARGGGLQFGLCLHVGEAVIGYMGVERTMNYVAVGKAVSQAARLAWLAEPGQILASATAADALRPWAELRALPQPPGTSEVVGPREAS